MLSSATLSALSISAGGSTRHAAAADAAAAAAADAADAADAAAAGALGLHTLIHNQPGPGRNPRNRSRLYNNA